MSTMETVKVSDDELIKQVTQRLIGAPPLTFGRLTRSYEEAAARFRRTSAIVGTVNRKTFESLVDRFQTQQRFMSTVDGAVPGTVSGLKFLNSTITINNNLPDNVITWEKDGQ